MSSTSTLFDRACCLVIQHPSDVSHDHHAKLLEIDKFLFSKNDIFWNSKVWKFSIWRLSSFTSFKLVVWVLGWEPGMSRSIMATFKKAWKTFQIFSSGFMSWLRGAYWELFCLSNFIKLVWFCHPWSAWLSFCNLG